MKQKQIDKVINLWRECKDEALMWDLNNVKNSLDVNVAKKNFIKKLEKLKYHLLAKGTFKSAFTKKSIDFVIKIYHNGSVDDRLQEESLFAKYFIRPTYFDGAISIQRKAKRINKNKAYKFFENIFGKDYCELYDIHPENVGWLNNKPVIFDFVECEMDV